MCQWRCEERLNFGYILKVKLIGFADGLDIGGKRKIKDNSKHFDCANWMIGNFEMGTQRESTDWC